MGRAEAEARGRDRPPRRRRARRAELEKTSIEADKTEKEIYAEKIRLDEKLKKIQPGFVSFARNMPVIDMLTRR